MAKVHLDLLCLEKTLTGAPLLNLRNVFRHLSESKWSRRARTGIRMEFESGRPHVAHLKMQMWVFMTELSDPKALGAQPPAERGEVREVGRPK